MLWVKVVVPIAMAAVGGGAAVAAVALPDTATAGPSRVWIDGPTPGVTLTAGATTVTAHATAASDIGALDLYVDGEKVAADDTLEQREKLVYATLPWTATDGEHELVVRQVGGTEQRSDPRVVLVGDNGTEIASAPSPGTTPPLDGTTTTLSSTPPSLPGATTTNPPGQGPDDTAPDTVPPDTIAPPEIDDTTPPPITEPAGPPPEIDAAVLVSSNQNRIYVGPCGYTIEVQVRARVADQVEVVVEGTAYRRTMSRNASSFTHTITSAIWAPGDVGSHRVVVIASGNGQTTQQVAGTLEILDRCPKD